LDYFKPNGYRASVPLIKFAATETPVKGMVLVNYGGPGISAVKRLAGDGQTMQESVGENYDIVAFDPRGIGYSIPSANCNTTDPNAGKRRRYDLPHGPLIPFEAMFDREQPLGVGAACQAAIGGDDQAGQHMSTATVARDMRSIVEAYAKTPEAADIKDKSLLNYMGYSYGTIIGQNFASMFPEMIGRVAIDGVVDPDDNDVGLPIRHLMSTDDEFATFFIYCHLAGPDKCDFYTGDHPGDIFFRFEHILSQLDTELSNELDWANTTDIEDTLYNLKNVIFDSLYAPRYGFSAIATLLFDMETHLQNHNLTRLVDSLQSAEVRPPGIAGEDSWMPGVACSDNSNTAYGLTDEDFKQYTTLLMQQSYIGGEILVSGWYQCVGWSIQAVETFKGR
jgi:pimeloyl-ACP methyl ester carboxylesterase